MHYQLPPNGEVKVVRCIRGSLMDVIVDLRPKSPTYLKWFGHELTAENRTMMYVPVGFAHGFLTTSDDAEALYLVSSFYAPNDERGLRYNDPEDRPSSGRLPRLLSPPRMRRIPTSQKSAI